MKIRIKGNFIRFRLTKSDVEQLSIQGIVTEETHIDPKTVFRYSLKSNTEINNLEVSYKNDHLQINMPGRNAEEWVNNSKVGYSNIIEIDSKTKLELLIEKDFQCLDETSEDQTDNYPNPLAN